MFLSWIFPHVCIFCQQSSDTERALCSHCLAELRRVPRPLCLYCGAPVDGDHAYPNACSECDGKPRPFSFARSALTRSEQSMELVYRLKFCREIYMARACAPLMDALWEEHDCLSRTSDWVLVPVPVSADRLQERRYNQAYELALALSQLRGKMPIAEYLMRLPSPIQSQSKLSANKRMAHARAVFRLKPAFLRAGQSFPAHLLLIDDVYTTGSTTRACARLLKRLPGVKKVGVITLLRIPKR